MFSQERVTPRCLGNTEGTPGHGHKASNGQDNFACCSSPAASLGFAHFGVLHRNGPFWRRLVRSLQALTSGSPPPPPERFPAESAG